jgi:glycosyltransferase involved in cell wall biosynthesis
LISVVSVVSNDIVTDNRVHKIAMSLCHNGYDVTVVGRRLKSSIPLSGRPYPVRRFRLWINKGPLFYANLNLRIFLFLLRCRKQIILSNDLDTLPACYAASRILRSKLVFDSHELFPEVPELVHRPRIKKFWSTLENILVRKIHFGLTVSDSIAGYYSISYNVPFITIRNLAPFRPVSDFEGMTKNRGPSIVIYQGSLNLGRGLELAIESMLYLENTELWILGDGDINTRLVGMVADLGLNGKVEFKGKVPIEQLWQYTARADVGISLEEDMGLNYQYSLPNKLFDYIQARIPVIVSDLPEMRTIVENYRIGEVLRERTPKRLAEMIREITGKMINYKEYGSAIDIAAQDLCWEREEDKLLSLFKRVCVSA